MKILNIDDKRFRIFDGQLTIKENLSAGVYDIDFSKSDGYSLLKRSNLTVNEKLYGKHEEKVAKILRSYDKFERSMGVIFSGDKGIGKSIAARMLCQKSVEKGLPVILVEKDTPGIARFIDSIQQECVVLFDEFEKNFKAVENYDDEEKTSRDGGCQDALLSLFDGTGSNVKRLYLITCNDLRQLSDLFVNRPGRFHYHIRWDYPSAKEIEKYLKDKLDETAQDKIPEVIEFSAKMRLNYDCLRAIAFELNMGYDFHEAIEDINIINAGEENFSIFVRLKNGVTYSSHDEWIDLFATVDVKRYIANEHNDLISFVFVPSKIEIANGKMLVKNYKAFDKNGSQQKEITCQVAEAWIEPNNRINNYGFNLNI